MPFAFDGYELVTTPRGAPVQRFVARMLAETPGYYAVAAILESAPLGAILCASVGPYATADEAAQHVAEPVLAAPPPPPPEAATLA